MRVAVVGGGGREHALCLELARDPAVGTVICAPGNAGTDSFAEPHPVDVADAAAVAELAEKSQADLVVVGPEIPLVAGVADLLRARQIPVFGPSAAAARLEGSKAFAKEVMTAAGVPTAAAFSCAGETEVRAALERTGAPYVVKHDGLAAGKGVVVTDDLAEAVAHALAAPGTVVIEEYLDGPEVSLFCVVGSDGTAAALLPAQDAKRVGDGDTGPNTGGMGAYTPLGWAPEGLPAEIVRTVVDPTVREMAGRGTPFEGLLYVGLAMTSRGPRVVEFNVRFGDPETQAVLALLESPITQLLRGEQPVWAPGAAVTVVLAAGGYPAAPRTGDRIDGLESASGVSGVSVLHAGTTRDDEGHVISSGGRVLSVTATGSDLGQARERAYEGIARISLQGSHYRRDIGAAALAGNIAIPSAR